MKAYRMLCQDNSYGPEFMFDFTSSEGLAKQYSQQQALSFYKKYKFTHFSVWDSDNKLIGQYEVQAVPTLVE